VKTFMVLFIFSFVLMGCPGQRDGSDENDAPGTQGLSGSVLKLVVDPPEYQGPGELTEEERLKAELEEEERLKAELEEEERLKAELAEEERRNAEQDPDCAMELKSNGEYEPKCLFPYTPLDEVEH